MGLIIPHDVNEAYAKIGPSGEIGGSGFRIDGWSPPTTIAVEAELMYLIPRAYALKRSLPGADPRQTQLESYLKPIGAQYDELRKTAPPYDNGKEVYTYIFDVADLQDLKFAPNFRFLYGSGLRYANKRFPLDSSHGDVKGMIEIL